MSAMGSGRQVSLADAFERAVDGAEAGESEPAVQEGPQDLPCGHAPVYAESGTCMVCEQSFNTAEEFSVNRAAASDGREGRL